MSAAPPAAPGWDAPPFREDVRPVFIIGAPRSGTSIMTWALGQHPNIQAMEESNWLAAMAVGATRAHALGSSRGEFTHLSSSHYPLEAFLRRLGDFADTVVHEAFHQRLRDLYGDRPQAVARNALDQNPLRLLNDPGDPKARWVDGTPLNTHFAWGLARMFPRAVFIHNLRRPADVASSLESFDRLGAHALPLAEGLREWTRHVEAAALAERAFGAERVFRLRFERLSQDRESVLGDLFDFLGEGYCGDCVRALDLRLNSSAVAERREANAEAMLDMPEYLEASSLYWRLQDTRPGAADDDACAALEQRFHALCADRSLP